MHPEMRQIYWYSGIYLQPQHFQAVDLHHSYMLSNQRQLSRSWNFGIINLDFNIEALGDFTLKINHLQAILPSGDYLEYPGNCALIPKNFRDVWKQRESNIKLWLALRRFDPSYANVGNTPNNRWLSPSEEEMMKDVYFNGPECSVSHIVYNVQILSEEEKNTVVGYEFLPLLELRFENDSVSVAEDFCPPLVTLHGSPILKNLLESIFRELTSKAHQLDDYRYSGKINKTGQKNINYMMAICALNRIIPLFKHYYNSPIVHPWDIYGILSQFIGELTCFSDCCSFDSKINNEENFFLPYDHYHIYTCFTSIKKNITELLKNICLDISTLVKLSRGTNGVFYGDLGSIEWGKFNMILLVISSEEKPIKLPPESSSLKISSSFEITKLIQHALPGIPTHYLEPVKNGITNKKEKCYFRLDQNHNLWKKIKEQSSIAFYWDDAPDDLQVQLVFMEDA